jgi:hypothetical protein
VAPTGIEGLAKILHARNPISQPQLLEPIREGRITFSSSKIRTGSA